MSLTATGDKLLPLCNLIVSVTAILAASILYRNLNQHSVNEK
jgi:hypothetical protein